MSDPDFDKISKLLTELEAMCKRAKELRAELTEARKQGRFWRHSTDVKKSSITALRSEAADDTSTVN